MEGCVPDGFKTAVVSLIIKKATLPADDFKNYHPVSGLSFISKLVERLVAKQLLVIFMSITYTIHINQHIKWVTQLRQLVFL